MTRWPCADEMRQTLPDTGLETATQSGGNSSYSAVIRSIGQIRGVADLRRSLPSGARSASNAACWRALCAAMLVAIVGEKSTIVPQPKHLVADLELRAAVQEIGAKFEQFLRR